MYVLACQVPGVLNLTQAHVCIDVRQLLSSLPVTLHAAKSCWNFLDACFHTKLLLFDSSALGISLVFVLQLFSSTAAALPAEVGPDGKLLQPASTPPFAIASKPVLAWRRRLAARRSRRQQKKQSEQQ